MLWRNVSVALLCIFSLGVEAQTTSPQAFLESVYKPYLEKGYKGQAYSEADRFFAPDLAGAMKLDREAAEKSGKKPILDVDPSVDPKDNPKDWQISDLVVVAIPGGTGVATGQVLFVNQKKPAHLTINLVQTPAGWRIAEIRGNATLLRTLYKLR